MIHFKRKSKITEANIQAEFYHQCKLQLINIYLEYKHKNCRFDAIILNDWNEVVAIVEFKSFCKTTNTELNPETKQYKKYSVFGLPIIGCVRIDDIPKAINKIKELL